MRPSKKFLPACVLVAASLLVAACITVNPQPTTPESTPTSTPTPIVIYVTPEPTPTLSFLRLSLRQLPIPTGYCRIDSHPRTKSHDAPHSNGNAYAHSHSRANARPDACRSRDPRSHSNSYFRLQHQPRRQCSPLKPPRNQPLNQRLSRRRNLHLIPPLNQRLS